MAKATNNTCCVESPAGHKGCANFAGGATMPDDAPLCASCKLICGTKQLAPGEPPQNLIWKDNPTWVAIHAEEMQSTPSTVSMAIKSPSKGAGWLCAHCQPDSHYSPPGNLTRWHKAAGKHCTCWCASVNSTPLTQKAKGVLALQENNVGGSIKPPQAYLWQSTVAEAALKKPGTIVSSFAAQQLVQLAQASRNSFREISGFREGKDVVGPVPVLPPDFTGAVFVRPCPKTPRPGFVDSRCVMIPQPFDQKAAVAVITEIQGILKEAQAEDAESELLVMSYLPAEHNIVATTDSVVVGLGNDGATSGHETLTLPVIETDLQLAGLLKAAGITKAPHFEAVSYRGRDRGLQHWTQQTIMTQLRDGPKTRSGRAKNFIPAKLTVKTVVPARGTLLEWEKTALKIKDTEGLVVWHPRGSLISHYALHCIHSNIAIVTDIAEPTVGQVYESTIDADIVEVTPDVSTVRAGIEEGLSLKCGAILPSEAVTLMLYAVHNASVLDLSDKVNLRMLGYSIGTSIKLGAVACIGEMRHGDGTVDDKLGWLHGGSGGDRETSYEKHLSMNWEEVWPKFANRYIIFGYKGWSGSGIGGVKWYECSEAALRLWNSACAFVNAEGDFKQMLVELNRVVNVCHNGAKMLTKFTGGVAAFELASTKALWTAMLAAPTAYRLHTQVPIIDGTISFKPVKIESIYSLHKRLAEQRRQAGKTVD